MVRPNIALLTECIASSFVIYKDHTLNGVGVEGTFTVNLDMAHRRGDFTVFPRRNLFGCGYAALRLCVLIISVLKLFQRYDQRRGAENAETQERQFASESVVSLFGVS